jgi:hypothetical protein
LWENAPLNYNYPLLVNGRAFLVLAVCLLSLACAGRVLAGGAYQRTDDRKKTLVWNNDPQPGDAAEWSGGRDSEGYAEGPGTLKWSRVQRAFATGSNLATTRKATPISAYTGNMVHGKFEGSVVTVDHGKTYHATFADGQRKGRWSAGPAIAKAEKVEPEAPSEERAEAVNAEKTATAAEKVESTEKKTAEAEPQAPAEGPSPETKAEPAKADARLAKTETSSSALSADELEESPTPQRPVTKKAALAPGAVRAIEQPGRAAEKKAEKPKESQPKIKRATKVEEPKPEPANEKPSEPPGEGPPQIPNPVPSQPTHDAGAARTKPSAQQTPADDSIRTLTGPPTSLRTKSTPSAESSPPAPPVSAPSLAPAAPAPTASTPKLNTVQAMDIADIEARTRGYDLGEYQLPKAEYNAADDTWSVSYVPRDAEKSTKRLSVVVQDKSGKAEVKK